MSDQMAESRVIITTLNLRWKKEEGKFVDESPKEKKAKLLA